MPALQQGYPRAPVGRAEKSSEPCVRRAGTAAFLKDSGRTVLVAKKYTANPQAMPFRELPRQSCQGKREIECCGEQRTGIFHLVGFFLRRAQVCRRGVIFKTFAPQAEQFYGQTLGRSAGAQEKSDCADIQRSFTPEEGKHRLERGAGLTEDLFGCNVPLMRRFQFRNGIFLEAEAMQLLTILPEFLAVELQRPSIEKRTSPVQ